MLFRSLEEFGPEIETAVSRTGRAEIATDPMGVEISDTYIMLKPREEWHYDDKEALVHTIRGVGYILQQGDLE